MKARKNKPPKRVLALNEVYEPAPVIAPCAVSAEVRRATWTGGSGDRVCCRS